MDITFGLCLSSAAFSSGLGVIAIWRDRKSLAHLSFAAGMFLLAAEAVLQGLCLRAAGLADLPGMLRWQSVALLITGFVPAPWLLFSVCYGRGNYREFLRNWRLLLLLAFLAPTVLDIGFGDVMTRGIVRDPRSLELMVALGKPGTAVHVVFLLGAILVLMNLERTFRSSLGTMRWRIKYMVLGLAALFVFRIYLSSQAVLYSAADLSLQQLQGVVLLAACALVTLSFARGRAFTADIYPSHAVLYKSLTFILAGIYLLLVGLLAQVVRYYRLDIALPVRALLLLLALIGLSVLLLSERVRLRLRRFVSRHFRRPLYDYRQVWTTFTQQTTSLAAETDLCRKVVNWLSDTFQFLSVTIWLTSENKDRLIFGASTSIPSATVDDLAPSTETDSEIIRALASVSRPLDLEQTTERWADLLKRRNPEFFPDKGGNRACVPLIARGELLGLAIVGDRVSGLPFAAEDLDLLKCIGDQVAATLLNIELSRRLLQAKEMEAFQTMSAFFVHDLKNTTFTLSLLLQNLREHFDDPAFREDALRAVSKSVEHMNHLIERLSFLRHELKLHAVEADLNEVVRAALRSLGGTLPARLSTSLTPLPKTPLDPEQVQKVIVNLLLNAADATGASGEVRLETGQRDGWVVCTVSDNGCGMSPDFLRKSLFRPFQTTKKKGIGIGMFHSKMIVDAHSGRIEVESEVGKGTTFRVLLPAKSTPA